MHDGDEYVESVFLCSISGCHATGTVPPTIPTTDFQTGFFSIFTAGNFGGDIAFWVDDDISVGGDNSAGGLGDGYLKFVNIGRIFKLPKDSLITAYRPVRVGLAIHASALYQSQSVRHLFRKQYRSHELAVSLQQNVSNAFAFAGAAKGVELSGGHFYGGYHYSVAVLDQNTSGICQGSNVFAFVPSATGGAGGGVGFGSDSSLKDIYSRFSYRFNLEHDPESRNSIQAAGATGPRDHTYLNLGSFYFTGKSQQGL